MRNRRTARFAAISPNKARRMNMSMDENNVDEQQRGGDIEATSGGGG
jgi:hypothetical protein